MKLSAYIVKVDSGFAPNPFGRLCTLACCKPRLRRYAQVGDVVLGTSSVASGSAGRLIYAMRVREVLSFEEYWIRFPSRRPNSETDVKKRGDNIWHRDANRRWRCVQEAFHDKTHQKRDLSGQNVLVASDFYYFGRKSIPVPGRFRKLMAVTQGYKNTHNNGLIDAFWNWVRKEAPKRGRIGKPSQWGASACSVCRQHREGADEDVDESEPHRESA